VTYTTLVSTDVLAEHLDGSWAIIDCRYDLRDTTWGVEQYRSGHIPGAAYASVSHDLSAPPTGTHGRHPLPCVEEMETLFSLLGISPGVQVVVYDQGAGMYASRLWWMLRYLGHEAVALLDGGWTKWTREGRPVRAGYEERPRAAFTGERRKEMRLPVAQVETAVGNPAMLLVDARAQERFEGRNETVDRVAGHIPGAVNHPYANNVTDEGVLFPPEQLRQQFKDTIGDRSPDQVVMYCGSGVTACLNVLAMEYAGLPGAKLYVGSWSEWSSDPARPIETGPVEVQSSKVR
jgi:thiosulfate/3-mercaptopyruvate sulfurtransferase